MVFIDVIGPKGARTVAFPIAELNIGSASDCDLQLDHPDVAAHHASVIERGGHAVVLDLGSAITRVDGTPAKGATVLTEESEVVIGPFRLRFRHVDLPPDTVQTQTVRQPSAPPIPMADTDIEILSMSEPFEPVHSSEVVITPATNLDFKPIKLDDETKKSTKPAPAPAPVPRHAVTLSSSRRLMSEKAPVPAASIVEKVEKVEKVEHVEKIDPPVQSYDPQSSVETDPSIPVGGAVAFPDDSITTSPHGGVQSLLRASDDPIEAEFLRAIVEDEDATDARIVYADWLEERGAIARAEYMRLLSKLEPGKNNEDSLEPARLRVLGKQIANTWRATVALRSTPIERCPLEMIRGKSKTAQPSGCPKTWGALERWHAADLRVCNQCTKPVHYMSDLEEARRWAAHGNPLVIDPAMWRSPDDLESRVPSSHFIIEGRRPWDVELPATADPSSSNNHNRNGQASRLFADCAMLEAAAVTAFERLARELNALGAPASLQRRALDAACEETRHARAMHDLARGVSSSSSDVEVQWPDVSSTFAKRHASETARENAIEGCVRETYGALVAEHQAANASSIEVRRALAAIAVEERRHMELSWDVARWLEPRLSPEAQAKIVESRAKAVADLYTDVVVEPSDEIVRVAGYPTAVRAAELVAEVARIVEVESRDLLLQTL